MPGSPAATTRETSPSDTDFQVTARRCSSSLRPTNPRLVRRHQRGSAGMMAAGSSATSSPSTPSEAELPRSRAGGAGVGGLGEHGRRRQTADLQHGRVVAEDRVLERAEARRRLQPDVGEQLAHVVGAPDGVGLAPGAVEGHEEVLPQALAQRVRGDQLLELGDEAGGVTAEVGGDAVLEHGQAHGFEAVGLALGERLVGELRQRGAAPLGQGGVQALAGQGRVAGGERLASRAGGRLEVPGVEGVLTELEHVAGCPTHEERGWLPGEPRGLEHASQPAPRSCGGWHRVARGARWATGRRSARRPTRSRPRAAAAP